MAGLLRCRGNGGQRGAFSDSVHCVTQAETAFMRERPWGAFVLLQLYGGYVDAVAGDWQ